MVARDGWIGWSTEERPRNLPFIVNNSCFRSQLRPLLLETLVDGRRFAGSCYRAANWILLGETQGRGRMDRYHQADGSARKLLLVYPLCRDVQQRLRQAQPPRFSEVETEADWV